MKRVEKVAVLGAGIMGHGIAQGAAVHGCRVWMYDLGEPVLEQAFERIDRSLERMVDSGKIEAEKAREARNRITPTTALAEAVGEAELVIEAITEDLEAKQRLLAEADSLAPRATVFASNTSQFSITRLAAASGRPDRFCGMHFFNPPQVMALVEVVRGLLTSDETFALVEETARSWGKQTVVCRDSQGFITSRLIAAFMAEAMRIVEEGVAQPEDVDRACRLAFNHRMGPLETADLVGLDTAVHILDSLRQAYGDRFLAPQGLRNRVAAGQLGRKAGRGFYSYDSGA